MKIKGHITKVYYFSPHEGLLSKIVLEVKAENGERLQVEKMDTQEELAKVFGFLIKEPHVWDTRSPEHRACIVDVSKDGQTTIAYL